MISDKNAFGITHIFINFNFKSFYGSISFIEH